MTDDAHMSSDEETPKEGGAEAAALARKRRLLAMKSRMHGVEMREEDYNEEQKPTKKAKTGESGFRSYQPVSELLGQSEAVAPLDIVEQEITEHLKDTKDTRAIEEIDISTLAPKKIDWDLKRDMEKKMQKLERRTQRAIAELIRQRLSQGMGDLASTVTTAGL